MKQIRTLIMSLFIGIGFLAPSAMILAPSSAFAVSHTVPVAEDCTDAKSCANQGVCALDPASCTSGEPSKKVNDTVETVINILSVVVGVASIIMIILAGLKFVTSSGAPEKVSSARNTILYAVIGLVIVGLAQIIVFFVLNQLKNPTP